MSADNGGPAFPSEQHETHNGEWNQTYEPGMTLRDYFAARALPAIISAYVEANGRCIGTDHFPANCAAHAYRMADAMLMERDK